MDTEMALLSGLDFATPCLVLRFFFARGNMLYD